MATRTPLSGGRWVTVEGEHVYIKHGVIVAGHTPTNVTTHDSAKVVPIVSGKPSGISSQSAEWIRRWTHGDDSADESGGTDNNHKRIIKQLDNKTVSELSSARPDEPITVYRSHIVGRDSSDVESWTTDKGLAETISDPEFATDNHKRVVLTRRVHPSEIVYSAPHLPEHLQDNAVPSEVVVANGTFAKKMSVIRGEQLTKGQQWSGKWSSFGRYGKSVPPGEAVS